MRQFVAACTARRFEGFKPQDLANVINGELVFTAVAWPGSTVGEKRKTYAWQAWRSWSTSLRRSS
jgi:hypothetical protein